MSLLFYDWEVFKYDNLVVIVDPINKEKHSFVNDRGGFVKFYEAHVDDVWCGFNSRGYDSWITKAVIAGFDPYEMNDWIINKKLKGWQFSKILMNIPLNNYDCMTSFHGLKTLEAFKGSNIYESSVPFDIDRKLTDAELDEVLKYCENDVMETLAIFLLSKDEFDSYMSLIKMFNLPISYLNKSKAQLSAAILGATKIKRNDEWDIQFVDTLKLEKYRHVKEWYTKPENMDYEKELITDVAGIPHTFSYGGLHSSKENYVDKGDFLAIDVQSYYPSLMIQYGFGSRSADFKKYKDIYDLRLQLKKEGKKKEQAPLKIVLNATYGASKDEYNPLYDPRQANNVCINGQLLLLDLIEKLEYKCDLIFANTDGLLIKITQNNEDKIRAICNEWETRTRMVLDYEKYKKVIIKDVNNYIIIDENDKLKTKGAYVKPLNLLDNNLPIVNKAVVNYLVYKIRPEDTIFSCDDMLQFQQVFKVSGKYMYAMHGEEKLNGKCFRVFASRSLSDGGIFKKKNEDKNKEKFANSPERVFIENGDVTNMKVPRKLDKRWYIDLAYKRIKQFIGEK